MVFLDELGRGTSTFDGTAIASATVKHLVERSQCLSLFATHYHSLLDEWKNAPNVRLGHMQCIVDDDDGTDSEGNSNITFLYTLGPGSCPKVRLLCVWERMLFWAGLLVEFCMCFLCLLNVTNALPFSRFDSPSESMLRN